MKDNPLNLNGNLAISRNLRNPSSIVSQVGPSRLANCFVIVLTLFPRLTTRR